MEKAYGNLPQFELKDELDSYIEEIKIQGFTVVEDVLSLDDLREIKEKALSIYQKLENEYGKEYLIEINELDMLRAPLVHDPIFLKLINHKKINELLLRIMEQNFSLHLQNAIINRPSTIHHQRSWHRDLPYQNYVTSKPFSISTLACIDDFTKDNGATELIPFSHNLEKMPSVEYCEKHMTTAIAKAGSLIVFNSLLIHRAGQNNSQNLRLGINHMFTAPILKQQISLPEALSGVYSDDQELRKILGYDYQVPCSDREWKEKHYRRKYVDKI
jgi:ectoine hydroxylase-related dioxygenase (phytanoyl-CoA dioxygenase family)